MSSSTSDSDACERVRNVRSVLIKSESRQHDTDEDCTYKQRLGDLIFDANFETGNLGFVDRVDEFEYDLMVRPDVTNPRYRLWFNFTVCNQRPNQCVIFTFVNLSNCSRLFHLGSTPVVRSKLNPDWVRLHEDQVFYYRSPSHGNNYVLSVAFRFKNYDNKHQFALFYPYSSTTLTSFITRWTVELKRQKHSEPVESMIENRVAMRRSPDTRGSSRLSNHSDIERLRTRSSQGFSNVPKSFSQPGEDLVFEARSIGMSLTMKPVHMLSIRGSEVHKKPLVVILCRTRGNIDSVSSLVCQGLVDYMLTNSLVARVARQYMEFIIFPMLDPDSVCAGNTRSDIMGQPRITMKLVRSNRSIYANYLLAHELVEQRIKGSKSRTVIVDIGVNLNLVGSRIVGDYYEDKLRLERYLLLPRLLSRFSDNFYLEQCVFTKTSALEPIPFRFQTALVDHYRLELSPYAHYKRSLTEHSYEEYDQWKYLALGKALVYSLIEMLKSKDKGLPHCVAAVFEDFHPKATDIDNLTLHSNRSNRIGGGKSL